MLAKNSISRKYNVSDCPKLPFCTMITHLSSWILALLWGPALTAMATAFSFLMKQSYICALIAMMVSNTAHPSLLLAHILGTSDTLKPVK